MMRQMYEEISGLCSLYAGADHVDGESADRNKKVS
jgi:hypothetical protein